MLIKLKNNSNEIRKDIPTVLVDYAHKPDALEKTLLTLKKLIKNNGKLISVFGCGGDRDKSKRPIMGEISSKLADFTIITSDNPRTEQADAIIEQIVSGIQNQTAVQCISNRRDAIFSAINNASIDDIIVIAGKGHENYQVIGTEKLYFSDLQVAKEALNNKYNI